MVYAEFGGQTECIMGNWKIENKELENKVEKLKYKKFGGHVACHTCVLRGARLSSLLTNACSSEDNILFPSLAYHIVLCGEG